MSSGVTIEGTMAIRSGPDLPGSGHLSETAEHYLEAIYYIDHEGEVARPGGLADWLGVSAPTVTLAVHRLARDGWLEVAPDRSLTLTAAGEGVASTIVRRHRILERWLVDVLGLDWAAADREAALMAHGVSETVVPRLDEQLAHPRSCPHGNPIPGRGEVPDGLVRLDQLALGVPAVVVRISEVAEHEAPQLLHLLHQLAIMPGRSVALRTRGSTMGVDVDGRQLQVDCAAARTVWVVVGDLA